MEVVSVTCHPEFDPPMIEIVVAGQLPFTVSTGIYQYLLTIWPDLPPNPCGS